MNALVDVTARMVKDHVKLVAGADAAGPRLPAFSLHTELVDLVRAGMTPLQALQTATLNPAIAFDRTSDLGTIAKDKLADLILLDANPLERIENTQRITTVFRMVTCTGAPTWTSCLPPRRGSLRLTSLMIPIRANKPPCRH